MSSTEAATAAPAPVNAPETVETTSTPNKFDNVGKTVGGKVKGLFKVINTAGEQLRGNINAALDGTGDAIAGRKSGEVTSKGVNPTAPAATEATAAEPVAESSAAPATAASVDAAPAAGASATEATATTPSTNATPGQKQFPVGQFINKSLKRTVTLIKNVTNNLRSNVNTGVHGVGNTLSQQKDRASKRFSRAPRAEAEPVATAVEPESVTPEVAAPTPNNTTAEIVPAAAPAVEA
ncbi:uncharacterized protein MELLADRAFT_70956 [Melampsora larici-populina 98AG31]|uniref:Uncharacterized protein n=1 Tax=Melampsora larici-populina (strain 98AG31 / pathotype 3-4-7) TaxID=747676 RepID=F4RAB5_MELLP|nr:uncharacterized protein MELLADRAFT_70956 [Melampsora larici-populina 98AG31]EGG10810.1 hypothetical protein MELLADRAFT_70956 [Melampsora larici-populina 98AG31]